MKLETAELITDFARFCGSVASLVGIGFMVGSLFFGSPHQRILAFKLGGVSFGSELALIGAALMGKGDESDFFEESEPLAQVNKYAKCKGCKYWYGEKYGENHLVCAVHPEGVEGEYCKDWTRNS